MDRKLQDDLKALLLEVPNIDNPATRTSLLDNIPNRLSLPRDYTNVPNDISGLVTALAKARLTDGQWVIFILIENALSRLEGTMFGEQLKDLRLRIEASYSPTGKKTVGGGFPHGYAVIIGIAAYKEKSLQLSEAVMKDTMDMHTILRSSDHCGYANSHVQLLYDQHATAKAIREALQWLAEVTAKDEEATAIVYFSGHGGRIEIDGQVSYYLLPVDSDLENLDSTAITHTEFVQLLYAIRPPRLLVLLDSCYSGGMDEIKGGEQGSVKYGSEEPYYHLLAQGQGRVILASSSPDEVSRSSSALNNSVFTCYLLKALRGEVPSLFRGDGLIRVSDLFSYVSAQVPKGRPQHPRIITSDLEDFPNFPVALYRGGQKM